MNKLSRIPASAVLVAVALATLPASAAYFGSLVVKPGETQTLSVGAATRNVRVCNDFDSVGAAAVTIADNPAHRLGPGQCAEDIGDRMVVQSLADSPIRIDYRVILDQHNGRNFND